MADSLKYKLLKKEKNKYEFEVVVEYSEYEHFEEHAIAEESKKVKLPGFRPGFAPKEMVLAQLGNKVFSHAINELLPEFAYQLLTKEKLNPISNLDYSLKEFDKTKGIIYTIVFYTQPEIDLDKIKKLKIEKPKSDVEDKEVDDVITDMIRSRKKANAEASKTEETDDIDAEASKTEQHKDEKIVLDDQALEGLGFEEKTMSELKEKVKDAIGAMKKEQTTIEYNNKVIDAAVDAVSFEVPTDMVEDEARRREMDWENRLQQIKLDKDQFLATQGKTLEQVREDWKKEAEKAVKSDLILIYTALQEKVFATDEDVAKEIEKIEDTKLKAAYKDQRNKDYLKTLMTRERGLQKIIDTIEGK